MITVQTRGFLFLGRAPLSDPEDYNDWIEKAFTMTEFEKMLNDEVLPAGLIVQGVEKKDQSRLAVVVRLADGLVIRPIDEVHYERTATSIQRTNGKGNAGRQKNEDAASDQADILAASEASSRDQRKVDLGFSGL